jgi:hypothetical protein
MFGTAEKQYIILSKELINMVTKRRATVSVEVYVSSHLHALIGMMYIIYSISMVLRQSLQKRKADTISSSLSPSTYSFVTNR